MGAGGQGWVLDAARVDATVTAALRRRAANRRPGQDLGRLPAVWRERAVQVLGWRYRTHFAVVLTALVARATDGRADPHSLRVDRASEQPGRYSAAAVWRVFYRRAVAAGVSTNGLRQAAHNNQPYLAKPVVARGWSGTNPATVAMVDAVVGWLDELAGLGRPDAEAALDAFLVEVPDAPGVAAVAGTAGQALVPARVLDAVEVFLAADTEHGRRGQAFVAACLGLVHGEIAETAAAVNDPSRTSLGDVTVRGEGLALGAEAKQRAVSREEVRATAAVLAGREPGAALVYAALVNAEDGVPLAGAWREVTEATGVLTAVYDDPATLLRDAVVATARPFTEAVTDWCALLHDRLAHLQVRPATLDEWRGVAAGLGVTLTPGADGPGGDGPGAAAGP